MSEVVEEEVIDIEQNQTNGQIMPKAYWYAVKVSDTEKFYLTVIASGSTAAREGINQQFPNAAVSYMGMSEKIVQVNG